MSASIQPRQGGKRHFLATNSLAELAVALVVLGVAVAIAVVAIGSAAWVLLASACGFPEGGYRFAAFAIYGTWLVLCILLWRGFLRRVRRMPDLDLSEKGFFRFQMAIAACVFLFWLLVHRMPENGETFVNALRTLFEVLVTLATVAYITLAWGARKKVPVKIYLGLLLNLAVLFLRKPL